MLLEVSDLAKAYRGVHAVDGVSFEVGAGCTFAVVGESGCGKSTVARALLRLIEPDAGEIRLGGQDLRALHGEALRRMRSRLQMVFQDPYGSLNPRQRIGAQLAEPLRLHGQAGSLDVQVPLWLERVGLPAEVAQRYPHELSGGQRQRVAIARAVAVQPRLLVCDEPVSALDVSVQAQILNLLRELCQSLGLSCLFISHDLRVVRYMAERIAVMQNGRIVELAQTDRLWSAPEHPYTRQLLASLPPDL